MAPSLSGLDRPLQPSWLILEKEDSVFLVHLDETLRLFSIVKHRTTPIFFDLVTFIVIPVFNVRELLAPEEIIV